MNYRRYHLNYLVNELVARYSRLLNQIDFGSMGRPDDVLKIDGPRTRLAVDDFKAILSEIRKLK